MKPFNQNKTISNKSWLKSSMISKVATNQEEMEKEKEAI
jgi:hypothetical protein